MSTDTIIATPLTDSLRNSKKIWDELAPSLPETVPVNNNVQVPKALLGEWFDIAIANVQWGERKNVDQILKALYWSGVTNTVPQVAGHMSNAKSNGANWLQQTTPQLQGYLWSIRSSAMWLLPVPDGYLSLAGVPSIAEITARAEAIGTAANQISAAERSLRERLEAIHSTQTSLSADAEKIAGYERAANTASTNATASAATAEAEKQKVEAYVKGLEEAESTQKALFVEFNEKRDLIEATLQGASRVALAKSFEDRRKALQWLQYFWAVIFAFGIGVLTWVGYHLGTSVLEEAKVATSAAASVQAASVAVSGASGVVGIRAAQSNLLFSLLRFLILAPVVWLTWFAARQYGHTQRLGEDYAFKSAAAHAFVGYKEEMADDGEMLKLLRENAVRNFGANPIRVLSKSEPVTPLNDVFEKLLEKLDPEKLADVLKEALAKIKT
nr:hypothetical protein HUO10_000334 [Paraburkholderia busanensis]